MPKLLLITFINFGIMKSGSSVRPQRIYEAFKDLGYEVNLLSGVQNRKRERWSRVFKKFLEIRKNLPALCYVEPPSGPFFNFCDHLLLIYLKLKGVPIGLFYRDAYWLSVDRWHIKGLKQFFLIFMYRFDLFLFKRVCKIVFFPSQTMSDMFKLPRKGVLPPAGVDFVSPPHNATRRAIYVGGLSLFYGTDIMLKAFEIINEKLHKDIKLTVICRENEKKDFFSDYIGKDWLEVAHASGDKQLEPYYSKSDIGLYPSRNNKSMNFCMPIKLCEYMSRGLPVVTTDTTEAALFVQKTGCGLISKDTPEGFAQKIIELYETPFLLDELRSNAIKSLRENNLWVHRARQAAEEILN
jgi:glycosyltransferase involved in cell wall biosynthesis